MPTLLALIVASTGSFVFHKIHLPFGSIVQFFLDTVLWLILFIMTKRFLIDLRPK
jgi:hypothetical protein